MNQTTEQIKSKPPFASKAEDGAPYTMAEFCRVWGITVSACRVDSNPHMDDPIVGFLHYCCTLRGLEDRTLTTFFTMGPAHTAKPTVDDVLGCIVDDASSVKYSESFEDWAANLGYDTDSRKALTLYRTIEKQSDELEQFLGDLLEEAFLAEY